MATPSTVRRTPNPDPDAPNEDGAFSQLEKTKTRQKDGAKRQARIEELEDHSAERWSDPYTINAELRKSFRIEKKARIERAERDASLRERIGWSEDMPLVGESSGLATPDVRREWSEARDAPRSPRRSSTTTLKRRAARAPRMSAAARNLAGQILAPSRAKR